MNVTHGDSVPTSPHYYLWCTLRAMKGRCHNPNSHKYPTYGARGISVCQEWRDSYPAFKKYILETLGDRPEGMSLDRYPNRNGNYEPGNVRWATPKQQRANQNPHKPPKQHKVHRPYAKVGPSGYRWVYRFQDTNSWQGKFGFNAKHYYVPLAPTPEEAYRRVIALREQLGAPVPD